MRLNSPVYSPATRKEDIVKTLFRSVTTILLTLALAGSAYAEQPVPFKGKGAGQDVSVTFQADGIHILALVQGEATHVGRFTEELDYVLAYDFVHFSGVATITAANGDKLFIDFSGSIPGFILGVFPTPYSATFDVSGGTGKFGNASGSGSFGGLDYGGGLFDVTWMGAIEY